MSYRSVAELKAYAAQMLSHHEDDPVLAGSTTEDLADLIERWLSKSWDRVTTWRDWPWLTDTISLTWNSSGILYLPHFVQRIIELVPPVGQVANRVRIVNAREYSNRRSNENLLLLHGYYGVEADPPSATTITATSNAGASLDVGLQVRIEGLTTGNYDQVVTLTLAGVTNTATTTQSWKGAVGGVRRITIVPGTVPTGGGGIVTVVMGSTTIERLDASREREHEHQRTVLSSTGAGSTHEVRFIRRPFSVTVETDIVPIPNEFVDLLELGMMAELERLLKNYGTVTQLRTEWMERMKELSAWSNRVHGQPRSVEAPRTYSRHSV